MPRQIVPLTDVKIRAAKAKGKNSKLFDGGGLFLLITPTGGKLWRLKYRFGGTEKLLSLGSYPQTSLTEARQKRAHARSLLEKGINPGTVAKAQKAEENEQAETFEVIAREWHKKYSLNWASSHSDKVIRRLELYIFPWIGNKSIRSITVPELLACLRRLEAKGTLDTAHRAKQNCGQIFRYAIATGRADRDLTPDLRGALPSYQKQHYAAITDPAEVGSLLRAIDGYRGGFVTLCALRLAPHFFIRPGELRQAEWKEFDLEKREWNIPAEKLKLTKIEKARRKGEFHLVPLATQAIAILQDLKALTGESQYVFPSTRTLTRPMSNNTINAALRRLGYDTKTEMTGHGFRAMARTILDEVLHIRPEIIEHQLAHAVRDPLGRAYNRTTHLLERRKMMQSWADYLDELKNG
ncbi:tyrosine-type recombinase/integrase [Desulfofustis limnaeus]|uniref:Integrase n=1 Tax=Desulfofustis limnaeus TaxID=2740163 RepID=A0ABM7W592_9BACT|nr:integrase arm-type DNA-binding domain-containing protein [Desulfofustis limnaeus]BDD86083.1 integrase [Desulfofustis limnaeus]